MEQPPQDVQKKMLITPQEFEQEAKRDTSYLKLLPAELTNIVGDYAFNQLVESIAFIREKYLKDPKTSDKFLNDKAFNRELIDQLYKRFVNKQNEWAFRENPIIIETMLNTPASFKLSGYTSHTEWYRDQLLSAYRRYVKNAPLNYEQMLNYTKEFINNYIETVRNLPYTLQTFGYDIIDQVLEALINEEMIEKITGEKKPRALTPQNDINLIKIIIALDLGSVDIAHYWLKEFIVKSKYPEEICALWSDLLNKALQKNNFNNFIFLLNGIDQRFFPEGFVYGNDVHFKPLIKECLIHSLKGSVGLALINFIFNNIEFIDKEGQKNYREWMMLPFFMDTLLVDAINNPKATVQKILKWINYSGTNFDAKSHMPSKQELAYYRSGPGAGQQGGRAMYIEKDYAQAVARHQHGIEALRAVINSKQMDESVLSEIIKRGADINATDAQGITLLMRAIDNARVNFVRILLAQKDINKNVCDKQGHNALWHARNLDTDAGTRLAIIELLQQAGATEEDICAIQ